ncbi:MAG: phosphoribosylanthranilate isomerase [Nitrospinae bacterium]|nr:phosphoribosylanthranilate isomerase [Nitrospinota bacterium]
MIRVKICGVTTVQDAEFALEAGADALGLNFVPGTPRCLEVEQGREIAEALPPFGTRVGVFVNESPERVLEIAHRVDLDAAQLHGDETPEECRWLIERGLRVIRGLRVKGPETISQIDAFPDCAILLDAYVQGALGGTGETFDWELARQAAVAKPIILSGGLKPDNVGEAVRSVQPYGVDSSSGVEGAVLARKDPDRVLGFIENARTAISELEEMKR